MIKNITNIDARITNPIALHSIWARRFITVTAERTNCSGWTTVLFWSVAFKCSILQGEFGTLIAEAKQARWNAVNSNWSCLETEWPGKGEIMLRPDYDLARALRTGRPECQVRAYSKIQVRLWRRKSSAKIEVFFLFVLLLLFFFFSFFLYFL